MSSIDAVYVAVCRDDLRRARCCVASIRRWHPEVPICLLKDLTRGDFDTADLERFFGVEVRPEHVGHFGWGMAKFVPLTRATGERVLVLDADTVVHGPILDRFAHHDADLVAPFAMPGDDALRLSYFVPERVAELVPGAGPPYRVFNTGQFVVRTGVLAEEAVNELVDPGPPPVVRHPDVFLCGDQGLIAFMVDRAEREGRLSAASEQFLLWAGTPDRLKPRLRRIAALHGWVAVGRRPAVVHWAGPKRTRFTGSPYGYLLRHHERAYYRQVPGGRWALAKDVARREWALLRGRLPKMRWVEDPVL